MTGDTELEIKTTVNEPAEHSTPPEKAVGPETKAADAPKAKEPEPEPPRVSTLEVFQYADGIDKFLMIYGGIASFISGAGMPAFSYIFGDMINQLTAAEANVEEQLAKTSLIMVYVGIVVFFLMASHVACYMVSANRQITRIRTRFFSAIMRQDMAWHDEHKPGELTARMAGDTRVIQNGINDKFSNGITQLGMCLFGFGFGFYYSWQLTLVMLGTMPLLAIVGGLMANVMTAMTEQSREHFARAGSIATEVLENIRTVQVFGREDFETDRFGAAILDAQAAGIKKEFVANISIGVTYGVMFSSYAIAFFFSSYLIEWGDNDVGEITATFFSVLMGSFGVGLMFPSITAFTEARAAAHKVYEIINRVPPIDVEAAGASISAITDAIVFANVKFSYPTRKDQLLFGDLSVTIKRGQKVAFSGPSGCGKSSIIGMLQRFYDPDAGAITVDGVDMRALSLEQWRDMIGIVSQEPNLFSGSILDNVRVGKPTATLEEVQAACVKANIHHTVMGLPDQYDTTVGAVGSQLSGGQKQRLAIARAIIKNPQLLILDEATSALDRKSEVEVQEALDGLMQGDGQKLTVVIIAHRLATIRNVDCIHFVHFDGVTGSTIAESGTFDELLERKGHFSAMALKQGADKPVTPEHATAHSPSKSARHHTEHDEALDTAVRAPRIDGRDDIPIEKLAAHEVAQKEVPALRILAMNKEYSWALVLGLIGSIISGGVYPVYAVVLGKMLEVLGRYANDIPELRHQTSIWGSLFIAIGVGALAGWALQAFYGFAGEHLTSKLRRALFRNVLRQDQSFFDTPGRDAGALSGILSGDTEAVHQLWGPSIGFKVQMACNIIAGLAIGFYYLWKLAFVTLATLPVMIVTGAVQQMLLVGFGHQGEGEVDSVVTESLTNIRTVTAFNMQRARMELYEKTNAAELPSAIRNSIIIGIVWGFTQFSFYGVFALAFWYGGVLIQNGEATFGDVMITAMAVLMGAMGAGEAGGFAAKLADAQAAAKRVFAVIDRVPDIDPYETRDKELGSGCAIQLDRVRFVYPARPKQTVLQSVDATFDDKSQSGLMGQTGCGKSTIIQMLSRFYNAASGEVRINGKPLADIDIVTWRSQMSIVLQEPNLFSGTVRDNIRYAKLDASDADVERVARLAAIHDDILAMPNGYDTDVGYKGRALSGGQKQRVAIARGLLRQPRLLLLDEATSALDQATEARVQAGILQAHKDSPMTVIAIAHRLTTIRHSDKIVLLHDGEILEEGSHDELMAMGGEYKVRWELYQASTE